MRNNFFSLAVDVGAAVNISSENTYKSLQRSSHDGKWPLQPSDLNLSGVTGSNLQILGKVSLPLKLTKGISHFYTDFYLTSSFGYIQNKHPVDGLLGLTIMKARGMIMDTLQNTKSCGRRIVPAMEEPVLLSTMPNHVSPSERTQETIEELHRTTPVVSSEDRILPKHGKTLKPLYVETMKYQTVSQHQFEFAFHTHLLVVMSV